MNRKYVLLQDDTISYYGQTLHRIQAVRSFGDVNAGELGGYIHCEDNLSHDGNCWVSGNGRVSGNGCVSDCGCVTGNGHVTGNGRVTGCGCVTDNGCVTSNGCVSDCGCVTGNGHVTGNGRVTGCEYVGNHADITTRRDLYAQGPIGSRDDYVTFYRTKDHGIWVCAGCFNGSVEDFAAAIKGKHGDNEYAQEYFDAIAAAKKRLGETKEKNSRNLNTSYSKR